MAGLIDKVIGADMKPTKQRIALCEVMDDAEKNREHLTAEDICQRAFGAGENVATTYRFLSEMERLGEIESFQFADGRSRYEIAGKRHGHTVNMASGKVGEFDLTTSEIWGIIKREAEKAGFSNIARVKFEIFGE